MPQGAVIKCMAIYDEPFWRADGLTGQAISDAGPVKVIFDNSPPDGSPGVLLGFLEGAPRARELGRVAPEERRAAVLGDLARLFGAAGAPSPRLRRAATGPTRSGPAAATAATCRPACWTAYGPALRAPIGPIHWAGAETATVWNGYMDGAVRSGEEAAAAILRSPSVWPLRGPGR